jgi:hypothetical protein
MSNIFKHDIQVKLREEDHRYFNQHGEEYLSQSKFVGLFKEKFDTEGMSQRMAGSAIQKEGGKLTREAVDAKAKEIRDKWSNIGLDSTDHGTLIHNQLENYGKGLSSKVDKSFMQLCESVYAPHLDKYKWFNEQVFFLEEHKIAGTADLPIMRKKSAKVVIDIDDFKTNKRNGIQFNDKYGNYLHYPIDHLEACNYNYYALQLSIYAYMIQQTWGYAIGSLTIVSLDVKIENGICKGFSVNRIPVPYMYHEVRMMFAQFKNIKKQVI